MKTGGLSRVLKTGAAQSSELIGLTGLVRRRQQGLRILMYHGVVDRLEGPAAFGGLFLSTADFARQMQHVKRSYQVVELQEGIRALAVGRPLPERALAITFDDGYRNTIAAALPVLRALQLPATVFVVTDMAGGPELVWFDAVRILVADCAAGKNAVDLGSGIAIDGRMDDPEQVWSSTLLAIRALPHQPQEAIVRRLGRLSCEGGWATRHPEFALAGWDEWREVPAGVLRVGSHARRHGDLPLMPDDERLVDLRESKHRVERELSAPCEAIAYPYGAWNETVAQRARQAGYTCGLTTDDGLNGAGCDLFALRRTMVGDKGSLPLFTARASGLWDALRGVGR